MRLIDLDAFLEEHKHDFNSLSKDDMYWRDVLMFRTPVVDAAPIIHGIWIGESDGYADGEPVVDVWYCSECDHCIDDGTDDESLLPNYCPDCGAKMDGKTYKQEVSE